MDIARARVLVTGAGGFIGSHLTETLVKQGCDVRALVQYNSKSSWGWLDSSPHASDIDVHLGDLRDSHFCDEVTKGRDIIFNLGALIAIPYSYLAPDSYVDTNIKGTLNICQSARRNDCARVIQTSTSEVYGTAQYVPIDEKHPLQPQSPYSASKIGSDAMALSFYHSFELGVVLARPFNTYGPRQSARAVIPTIITQIAAGHDSIQLGAVSPTRDFNYVKDTCNGFIALAQCDEAVGNVVNIGSNFEVSIGDTARIIMGIIGKEVEIITDEQRLRPKDSEVERLWCDNSLLKELTGFTPKYSFEEGLSETIEWFTEPKNLQLYKEGIYNV